VVISGTPKAEELVRIWSSPTKRKKKGEPFTIKGAELQFKVKDLGAVKGKGAEKRFVPKPLYVEGFNHSGAVRDVTIVATLKPKEGPERSDSVAITFVWAKITGFKNKRSDVPSSKNEAYLRMFKKRVGSFGLADPTEGIGVKNGIEVTAQILVKGIENEDPQHVRFDFTRQAHTRDYQVLETDLQHHTNKRSDFPTKKDFKEYVNEVPNDDPKSAPEMVDEVNAPDGKRQIYSLDGPGPRTVDAGNVIHFTMFLSAREFVRVRFDGEEFLEREHLVEGTRSSMNFEWHSLIALTPDDKTKYVRTEAPFASPALPMTGMKGAGKVAASPTAKSKSEFWVLTHTGKNNEWAVEGIVSGKQKANAITGKEYTSAGGEVTFTITETKPFQKGDQFIFRTIVAHKNEIDKGKTTVPDGP
jgi:hypothetical protein